MRVPDTKGGTCFVWLQQGATRMATTTIVGTITGIFDHALDGLAARLLRRSHVGDTVIVDRGAR